MLKRKQLLFPDWLEAYIKNRAKLTKKSEGEIVRGLTCLGLLHVFELLGYKRSDGIDEKTVQLVKEVRENKSLDAAKVRGYFEDLYFETRKTVDEHLTKEAALLPASENQPQ